MNNIHTIDKIEDAIQFDGAPIYLAGNGWTKPPYIKSSIEEEPSAFYEINRFLLYKFNFVIGIEITQPSGSEQGRFARQHAAKLVFHELYDPITYRIRRILSQMNYRDYDETKNELQRLLEDIEGNDE